MPAFKQNGGVNRQRGVVCHSMVGSYAAALGELRNPNRQASWHFSVLKSGLVVQHAELTAQCWHAGSARNNDLIGIEHEGGLNPYNEPLTPAQLDASVALVRWLAKECPFPLVRGVGLLEHNEVSGSPTACPSNRIPWDKYEEEDVPTQAEWDKHRAEFGELFKYTQRVDAATKFLIDVTINLAGQVYGDADPKTLDLAQRVKALEDG